MDYFNQLAKTEKLNFYRIMKKIRFFEQAVFQLTAQGLVHGSVHFYIGQEAIAAGAISGLKKEDYIITTHRCHGHIYL
jgi:TPP-dependent pyruvate/acetoin dehydrogenase alpha subunit